MRLAIFGAGASLGSQESDVPPLGADLFSALVAFSPTVWLLAVAVARPIPPRLRRGHVRLHIRRRVRRSASMGDGGILLQVLQAKP